MVCWPWTLLVQFSYCYLCANVGLQVLMQVIWTKLLAYSRILDCIGLWWYLFHLSSFLFQWKSKFAFFFEILKGLSVYRKMMIPCFWWASWLAILPCSIFYLLLPYTCVAACLFTAFVYCNFVLLWLLSGLLYLFAAGACLLFCCYFVALL